MNEKHPIPRKTPSLADTNTISTKRRIGPVTYVSILFFLLACITYILSGVTRSSTTSSISIFSTPSHKVAPLGGKQIFDQPEIKAILKEYMSMVNKVVDGK